MTKERFMALQMQALQGLKADLEEHRKNPMVLSQMRNDLEQQYHAVLAKQAEWERSGFWTPDNERKYAEKYKDMAEA